MKLTKATKSWIAGFWEGEGSAGCYTYWSKSRNTGVLFRVTKSLSVQISQKDVFSLKLISKFYGGSIGYYISSTFKKNKKYYKLTLTANKARRFIKDIFPFVRNPARQNILIKALSKDRKLVNKHHHNYAKN